MKRLERCWCRLAVTRLEHAFLAPQNILQLRYAPILAINAYIDNGSGAHIPGGRMINLNKIL